MDRLRYWRIGPLAVCVGMLLASTSHAQTSLSPDAEQQKQRVTELIDQLGSRFFDEREAAVKELRQIGKSARPQLIEAKNHKSAEIRSRVAALLRMIDVLPLKEAIQQFAGQPEQKLDLEEGMWLISRILDNDVQRETLNKKLDALALAVKKKLKPDEVPKTVAPTRMVKILCEVLFEDEKFEGNSLDYENPANSSLDKVLESRKGLPILLSQMVMAVGKRLEIPIVGVPSPGRYIVKYDGRQAPPGFPKDDIFIDPYGDGKVLTREDRLERFPGSDPDRFPEPQTRRQDLIRMLNNIETHLFNRDEIDRAYLAVEFRVALEQRLPE